MSPSCRDRPDALAGGQRSRPRSRLGILARTSRGTRRPCETPQTRMKVTSMRQQKLGVWVGVGVPG
jgi:hypothetical protein